MRKAPVSGEPVFPAKTPNTRELADQRGAQRVGLGYDQGFVKTDRSARRLEFGTDAAIFDVSRDIERKDVEATQDGLALVKKATGAFTGATVAKFRRGDDADAQIVAPDLGDLVEHSALRISNEIRDDIGGDHVARQSQVDCLQGKKRRIETVWEFNVGGEGG
jgi:hypothetical protein